MRKVSIHAPSSLFELKARVPLPGSKSESNRALMLQALSALPIQIHNLSEAEDTQTMLNLLADVKNLGQKSDTLVVNVGPAGTVMRFLTAFLSIQEGKEFVLTGSERMQARPIKVLVDALLALGADIHYEKNTGFPPLRIRGKKLHGKSIHILGNISSQYISALLMIAPLLAEGLSLHIEGELTSRPYVDMTLAMMKQLGVQAIQQTNLISIPAQAYQSGDISIESDWSAASYWFTIAALAPKSDLLLEGLHPESLQGDAAVLIVMKKFGVHASFESRGLRITKTALDTNAHSFEIEKSSLDSAKHPLKIDEPSTGIDEFSFDFKECPDLAQTVIACAAGLGHSARFTGLETLKIKETDRIAAMQIELSKIGVSLVEEGSLSLSNSSSGWYRLDCSKRKLPQKVQFSTYHDHRMAMALTPLAFIIPEVIFDDRDVVDKSYPAFWNHLELIGFTIQKLQDYGG